MKPKTTILCKPLSFRYDVSLSSTLHNRITPWCMVYLSGLYSVQTLSLVYKRLVCINIPHTTMWPIFKSIDL